MNGKKITELENIETDPVLVIPVGNPASAFAQSITVLNLKDYINSEIPSVETHYKIYDATDSYDTGTIVYYSSSVISGLFKIITAATTAGENPETTPTKWLPISLEFVGNTYTADDIDYFVDIGAARTGIISYSADMTVPASVYYINITGDNLVDTSGVSLILNVHKASGIYPRVFNVSYSREVGQLIIYFSVIETDTLSNETVDIEFYLYGYGAS